MNCNVCGEKLSEYAKFCPVCGNSVDNNEQTKDIEEAVQPQKNEKDYVNKDGEESENEIIDLENYKPKDSMKGIKFAGILVLICFVITAGVFIYFVNNSAIKKAQKNAESGNYSEAQVLAGKENTPEGKAYYNYYGLLSDICEVVAVTEVDSFDSAMGNLSGTSSSVEKQRNYLSQEDNDNYGVIVSAINYYYNGEILLDNIESGMEAVNDYKELADTLKSGETFVPKELHNKEKSLRNDIESANTSYFELLGKNLPFYETLIDELDNIEADMSSCEDEGKYSSNMYYTEYDTTVGEVYTEETISKIKDVAYKRLCFNSADKLDKAVINVSIGLPYVTDSEIRGQSN